MRRRALAHGLVLVALAGCSPKPPATTERTPGAPALAAAPAQEKSSREKTVDEQIAEALKAVDPIVIYKRVPLPDDENAFVLLQRGMSKLVDTTADEKLDDAFTNALDSEPFPQGEPGRMLAEWLEKNAPALETIDAGIALEQCQFPPIDGPDTDMSYLAPLRQAARVKLVKAKLLAERGDAVGAAEELSGVLRLGRLLSRGEGAIIHGLVGIAIQKLGAGGMRWLAFSDAATGDALALMIVALGRDDHTGNSFATSLRVEFTCFCVPSVKWIVNDIKTKGAAKSMADALKMTYMLTPNSKNILSEEEIAELLPPGKLFDIGDTVRRGAALYAGLLRRSQSSWTRPQRREMTDTVAVLKSWKASPPPENPAGRIITDLLVPAMDAAIERAFLLRADLTATRAVVALRLFELRNGWLPERLDELVAAGILDSVPQDPFADKPLRYARDRCRVWSVGPDESDDGGRDEPAKWTGKDYVLEVPGAAARAP